METPGLNTPNGKDGTETLWWYVKRAAAVANGVTGSDNVKFLVVSPTTRYELKRNQNIPPHKLVCECSHQYYS